MFISTLKALLREGGSLVTLAEVGYPAPGGDASEVTKAYDLVVGSTEFGAESRAKYSHVILILDNHVKHAHDFPDPVQAEAALKSAARAEAERRVRSAKDAARRAGQLNEEAQREFEEAKKAAAEAGIDAPVSMKKFLADERAAEKRRREAEEKAKAEEEAAKAKAEEEAAEARRAEEEAARKAAEEAEEAARAQAAEQEEAVQQRREEEEAAAAAAQAAADKHAEEEAAAAAEEAAKAAEAAEQEKAKKDAKGSAGPVKSEGLAPKPEKDSK